MEPIIMLFQTFFLFPLAKVMAYVRLSKQQGTVGKYREQ